VPAVIPPAVRIIPTASPTPVPGHGPGGGVKGIIIGIVVPAVPVKRIVKRGPVKTPDPVGVVHGTAIVIVIDDRFYFIFVVIIGGVALIQIGFIHAVRENIAIFPGIFIDVVVHGLRAVFIFFHLADNGPFSRFFNGLTFHHCFLFFYYNGRRNIARIKIDVIRVIAGDIGSGRTCPQEEGHSS